METLKNKEQAKKLGVNGRKRVLQYFTWDQVATQTLQIYRSIEPETE
jgi:glycosyltransferase involved in cell wall biosynthesis